MVFIGRKSVIFALPLLLVLVLAGCGGGDSGTAASGGTSLRGTFLDSPVEGLEYSGDKGSSGITDDKGGFRFYDGETVSFRVGAVTLGSVRMKASEPIVTPVSLVSFARGAAVGADDGSVISIVRFLMSADRDGFYNTIEISDTLRKKLAKKPPLRLDAGVGSAAAIAAYLDKSTGQIVSESEAFEHLKKTLEDMGVAVDENATGGTAPRASDYVLLAWNDLGMHCMDGRDYSVFSILPPYNNLVAQLIYKGENPQLITSGVTITYEAAPSFDAKWNTTSVTKTNFWSYVQKLFGVTPEADVGLKGSRVQSKTPQPLHYDAAQQWWTAEGIPTSPRNDDGTYNRYPMVKVTAKDASGNLLAETTTVLPVSDEIDCRSCHGSGANAAAKPAKGWANLSDAEKDYKTNILRLHDGKHPNAVADHIDALRAKGWDYDTKGLEATADGGTPVLCAACHKSNALPGTGVDNLVSLTHALHRKHAEVKDPVTGVKLDESTNRDACYKCHPGATTECLRGAMGKAKNSDGSSRMQCQSCHGSMRAVGDSGREGWLDLPKCQNCHQQGVRYTSAVTDTATGALRASSDDRFATDPDTPAAGKSLYRYSTGHGALQCSACHGSTHAIYPSSRPEDNIQSIALQGYAGPVSKCSVCHGTSVPDSADGLGGPHGMHELGSVWVSNHPDYARGNQERCKACHGSNYRGSVLSKTKEFRKFITDLKTKYYIAGDMVSCYDCHDGPNGS